MNIAPRVSVLMAVYNGEKFVRLSVESILSQTFSDFEFVIVDDGSTDQTSSILASFADVRLAVHRIKHVGLTQAVNHGLRMCKGEFIARMDADDVARPDRLATQVALMDVDPTVDIVCCDILSINASGTVTGAQSLRSATNELIREGLLYQRVVKPIINPSVLMRRSVTDELQGYRDFPYCEEHDFWLRACDRFTIRRINEPLLQYRMHADGVSRAKFAIQATSGCMSAVNYLVHKAEKVDLFSERPDLFSKLSEIARSRLERDILPAAHGFREARESMGPHTRIQGVWKIASAVGRHGLRTLPRYNNRLKRRLVQELVETASELLREEASASCRAQTQGCKGWTLHSR